MDKQNWETAFLAVSKEAKIDLLRWIELLDNWDGEVIIKQPHNLSMNSNATETGWGAVLRKSLTAQGIFNKDERLLHINVKELLAVHKAVLKWKSKLKGKRVLL